MRKQILITFYLLACLLSSQAQNTQPANENNLNVDSIIQVSDQLSAQQRYVEALNTLVHALYDHPKYCIVKHKYLKLYYLSGASSVNFATDVLNNTPFENHDCGPWTDEERCEAMELLAHHHYSEAAGNMAKGNEYIKDDIQKMFVYGDSMKLVCDRIPSFPGYSSQDKKRKAEKIRLNPTESTDGILTIIDIISNPDSIKTLYKLAFKLATTSDDYFSLAYKLRNENYYSDAIKCYQKLFDDFEDYKSRREAYNFLVGVLVDQGLIDSAIHVQNRLPYKLKLTTENLCDNKEQVGDIAFDAGRYSFAIKQYEMTLSCTGDLTRKSYLYKKMSDAYYKLGDIKNGYKYYVMSL